MEANGLAGGHYFEPYAGGAGVALDLLFHEAAEHIHINDYDPAIYDFWVTITKQPEALLKMLHDTPITMDQWFHWRAVLRGEIEVDQVERGFATLFMNRTNRSGVLKGGVIGGKEQSGTYLLDARFKKDVLTKRIERIAAHADKITIYNEDALILLKRCKSFLPKKSLIYLDPPYYVKGQGLYRNFYFHDDHLAIAEELQKIDFGHHWVVSYDNVQEIQKMYQIAKALTYGINYSAQKRYLGSEIMFFSNQLKVPENELPTAKLAA